MGLWYPKDLPFDLVAFNDSDYAGASLDRKSTTGGCQFLGCRLISWQCKKQTVVANSTTEAEYIAASNCCGQRRVKSRERELHTTTISITSYPLKIQQNLSHFIIHVKMETKNTSSSGSDLEEPEIQKLQMQAKNLKENSLNKLNALKTTIQHLSSSNHSMSVLSRNMQNLEMQFSNETLHEKDSNSELRAIKGQFEHFIHSKMFELSKYNTNAREILQDFNAYTYHEAKLQGNNNSKHGLHCTIMCANLIANLTLDTEENKTILKQLKKANASLTQELKECRTNLDETGLLALKDIEIKEGLKTKAYEISVLNQKHDELVKKSLLTKSQLEGYLKEKTKVILDLKVKEEKDIDKMIEMDKQLKFLNEIVYTRNQSIQTIHMLAPKCSTYNGRPTFANP
ncbi:hypothetical protein Tco_0326861, partial [Tanacetum coccineum]